MMETFFENQFTYIDSQRGHQHIPIPQLFS